MKYYQEIGTSTPCCIWECSEDQMLAATCFDSTGRRMHSALCSGLIFSNPAYKEIPAVEAQQMILVAAETWLQVVRGKFRRLIKQQDIDRIKAFTEVVAAQTTVHGLKDRMKDTVAQQR